MKHQYRSRIFGYAVVSLALGLTSCQSMYFLNSEKKQKIAPECDKLAGQKLAIVVWADPSTLDMDPEAPYRVASTVAYYFELNKTKKELKGIDLVDTRKIAEWQEKQGNVGPTLANGDVAKQFHADMLLRIDLFDYTTRAPEANGLIMGRVGANVTVQRANENDPIYRSEIAASFPDDARNTVLDRTDGEVLNETLQRFGDALTRKFYAHEIPYE